MSKVKHYQPHDLTPDEDHQAKTFFRVMVTKQYTPEQIANIMKRMGILFVEHAQELTQRKAG